MSLPVPALAVNPLGWIIVGAAGLLTYKAGKKAGLEGETGIEKPNLCDRAVKGAMKTVYRAQKSVGQSLGKTKEKYGTMWQEVQTEGQE